MREETYSNKNRPLYQSVCLCVCAGRSRPALEQEAEQWLLDQSGAEGWRWRDGGALYRTNMGGGVKG